MSLRDKSLRGPLLVLCFGVMVVTLLGATIEPISEWSVDTFEKVVETISPEKNMDEPASAGRIAETKEKTRCEHCGIVVSTQRIAPVGDAPPVYEITVRLADRSTRVFSETHAPRWRPGERIVLIEGGNSPRQ
jgi:hypothetical protein